MKGAFDSEIAKFEFVSKLGVGVRAKHVLLQMDLQSEFHFTQLDKETLLRRRNCGKKTAVEILEAAARYKVSSALASEREISAISQLAAMERLSVTDLRLSVRAMNALERLKISTVGQLARIPDSDLLGISNFGKKSLREVRTKIAQLSSRGFVLWPDHRSLPGKLNSQITRIARRLRQLKNSRTLLNNDPRFGHLVRELGIEAKNAHEAADLIISRQVDPIDSLPLIRRINELVRVIQTGNRTPLEAELWNLTDGLGSDRNRRMIVGHLGWDGKPPRTLEAIGSVHKMTRERVRQICRPVEKLRLCRPFAPALDRTLKLAARVAPALASDIENQLLSGRLTRTGFSVESVVAAARDLGRSPPFAIEMLHSHRVVVSGGSHGILDRINRAARRSISHWGVGNAQDIASAVGAAVSLTQKLLPVLSGFKWLDEPSGWFWITSAPRNSLVTQIRKILAASPSIDVGELRTGVSRHHRKKGFAPPRRVLLEFCRQQPWCRIEGEKIATDGTLNASVILSDAEKIILKVLKEHGPVVQRQKFEQLCLEAGMNHHTFWVFLSYCPLICRHATGVYGLRGADVPIGLVERLMPRRAVRAKLLVDYGWSTNHKVQILYKISNGMLTNGIVSIPAALKAFVQGKFKLMTGDNCNIGTLVVKDDSGWGLGPFFTRRGGEPGDYLSIVFDPHGHVATVQIGDAGLTDEFVNSMSAADKAEDETKGIRPIATNEQMEPQPNSTLRPISPVE